MNDHNSRVPVPRNILIRGTNWAGDTIISLPAAKGIRRLFSRGTVTYWVPENVAPIVQAAGVCDEVITFPAASGGPVLRSISMAERLRKRSFDFVILFQNAFESAFTSFLAGIPLRAGYATDLRGPLLNVKIPFPPSIRDQHQVFYYLGIYEFIALLYPGHEKYETDEPDCTIPFSSSIKQKAREMVLQVGGDDRKPIFCVCPGSANSQAKRWPQEYFAELADLVTEQYGAQVVFCGSPQETELIEQIISMQQKPSAVNMSGMTDILGMMALMSCSRMVISNDTGSAHLAAAASATVVTLFGPTSPGATAPLGSRAYTLEGTASCAPCRHFRCPEPAHPCMRSLTPERVLDSIERILVSEKS